MKGFPQKLTRKPIPDDFPKKLSKGIPDHIFKNQYRRFFKEIDKLYTEGICEWFAEQNLYKKPLKAVVEEVSKQNIEGIVKKNLKEFVQKNAESN